MGISCTNERKSLVMCADTRTRRVRVSSSMRCLFSILISKWVHYMWEETYIYWSSVVTCKSSKCHLQVNMNQCVDGE